VNYKIESDENKTIAYISIKVKPFKYFLSQFLKSTCLRTCLNTFLLVYKNLARFSSHIKQKLNKIKVKKKPCMNEQSFSSLFITVWCIPSCFFARTIRNWLSASHITVDASLVISFREFFTTKFCPSRIKSYVSFYRILCYIDVMTNWKSSIIVSTNNNVYWVTVTTLFLFQWYIILEWF
jgi:hypothetical protein